MLAEGLAVGMEDEADATFDSIQKTLDDGMNGLEVDPLDISTNAMVGVTTTRQSNPTQRRIDELVDTVNKLINNRNEMCFPIYVGGRQIDEVFIDSKNRITTRSGGQVNA
jgi:hypothetical protein